MKSVVIHTDGSCWPNPGGPGGWAAVVVVDGVRSEMRGHIPAPTTNNRAELIAAIEALDSLTFPAEVDLYTDSEYLKNGATIWMLSWRRKGFKKVKNADLWGQISANIELHRIRWHWIPSHQNEGNENDRCDRLAEEMRMRPQPLAIALGSERS